jgi:hypothetical protein
MNEMTSQREAAAEAYGALEKQPQVFFLNSLGCQLTLGERGECYYIRTQKGQPQAVAVANLYALTEIHHQVDNQLMHLLRGDSGRPPDREYIAELYRIADYHSSPGTAEWFESLVERAYKLTADHFRLPTPARAEP